MLQLVVKRTKSSSVDELVENVNKIMVASAEEVFGIYSTWHPKKDNRINNDKPCKQLKRPSDRQKGNIDKSRQTGIKTY